jgi:hypothetical protein
MSDPKDYGPMWLVHGPLTDGMALFRGDKMPPHRFRSLERAERQAARLNQKVPGHKVIEGIGGRSGWRAL